MSERFYPILVQDPTAAETDMQAIKGLVERGALTKIYDAPSVTTITPMLATGPGMTISAVNLTKEGKNYRKEWDVAADKGTAIHKIAEKLYEIEEVDTYPEELRGFVTALIAWRDRWKPVEVTNEFVICGFGSNPPSTIFAGRADKTVDVYPPTRDGKNFVELQTTKPSRVLLDFKTLGKPKHLKDYPKGFLGNQIELVARAMAMPEGSVDVCGLVRLASDGQQQTTWINKWEWPPLYDCFLRCLTEYEFRRTDKWN